MKVFVVKPYEGIGPAKLGAHRTDIRAALGEPYSVQEAYEKWGISYPNKDFFFDAALQVSYDSNLCAEFIEAGSLPGLSFTFDGLDVHKSPPETVLLTIGQHGEPDTTDPEYPLNPIFRTLDLTLFRAHSEEDCFEAIGVGIPGYTT